MHVRRRRACGSPGTRESSGADCGEAAAPTAAREFRRTDRLLVRFDAFAPGDAPLTVTARLLNQQGTKMADVAGRAADGRRGQTVLSLSTSPLARPASSREGQYLLELTADAAKARSRHRAQ